jgi:hypothetical protein
LYFFDLKLAYDRTMRPLLLPSATIAQERGDTHQMDARQRSIRSDPMASRHVEFREPRMKPS